MTTDKDDCVYFYDYENRLVKIEDSSSVEVATHDYDALGRRIRVIDKTENPDVTTLFYYNPEWQVLIEFDDESDWERYYVYGNYIDEPLVMRENIYSADYYYAQDHLYSVVALTDDTGTVVERYEYDAYGKCAVLGTGADGLWFAGDDTTGSYSDTGIGNPYTFTGRRLDAFDTGNFLTMHSRHRTYDTYTARFLQQDPGEYVDGMNLYEYVLSRPISELDPSGKYIKVKYKQKVNESSLNGLRGLTQNDLTFTFRCLCCIRCNGTVLYLKIKGSVTLKLLGIGHTMWNTHFPRYDVKWGTPRGNLKERYAASTLSMLNCRV